jgi:CRISPR-associated exonuclease Cas4
MALAGIVLLLLAAAVWWIARGLQRRTGLPRARVRLDDAGQARVLERPLVSHRYQLTGRPDYLLEHQGKLIPVELKPTRSSRTPYESDILQLAAYCLLTEEHYGERPPFGILRYRDDGWEIPYDDRVRDRLLGALVAMTEAEQAGYATRSHNQPARCKRCSQRDYCDESLVD